MPCVGDRAASQPLCTRGQLIVGGSRQPRKVSAGACPRPLPCKPHQLYLLARFTAPTGLIATSPRVPPRLEIRSRASPASSQISFQLPPFIHLHCPQPSSKSESPSSVPGGTAPVGPQSVRGYSNSRLPPAAGSEPQCCISSPPPFPWLNPLTSHPAQPQAPVPWLGFRGR